MKTRVTNSQAQDALQAEEIIERLKPFMAQLNPVEHSFVYDMRENIGRFGQATLVSQKQLNWLRKLSGKYIKSFAAPDEQPAKRRPDRDKLVRKQVKGKQVGKDLLDEQGSGKPKQP